MASRGPKHKFGVRQRTTVEWSVNLLRAIEQLRGDESLSVWAEKVLRQNSEVAARLFAMGDEGFPPPVCKYIEIRLRQDQLDLQDQINERCKGVWHPNPSYEDSRSGITTIGVSAQTDTGIIDVS